MPNAELENLVSIGSLKREKFAQGEFDALLHSGHTRLADARRTDLSLESRFDLAYNAAHALALAALRRAGYRSSSRYAVFQTLPHTAKTPEAVWRVLAKCHGIRNAAEYEGDLAIDETLVRDLIGAAAAVETALNPRGDKSPPRK